MALVSCPECGHQVSEQALSCPNCGFGVKEHVDNEKVERAKLDAFWQNHKKFTPDDDGWFRLFSVYDYMVNRVTKTTKQLAKYQTVWFDSGVPSYPLDFCNGWFECLSETYYEIIKKICTTFSNLPDERIKENVVALKTYNPLNAARRILGRWNDFLMEPFRSNSPVILKQAENRYSIEVAQKSEMFVPCFAGEDYPANTNTQAFTVSS